MPDQQELFGWTPSPTAPHIPGSDTSRAAAERIRPAINALQSRVLEALRAAGSRGMTDDELQVSLGMNPSTQRPRRLELTARGLIERTEQRRPTRTGSKACVWVATTETEGE